METPPARVIRGRLSFGARTGPAARAVIAAWPSSFPNLGDARGVRCALRSVNPVRGWPASRRRWSDPPAVFPAAPSASVLSRDPTVTSGSPGAVGAASGASSADQMCHVVRRSRLGFYAQGRTHHDGLHCHGLSCLSRVFIAAAAAPPFLMARTPVGFGASSRHDCRSHRGANACPSACRRGRRLIGPAVFPPRRCPRLRFLRRPSNVRRLASTRCLTGLL